MIPIARWRAGTSRRGSSSTRRSSIRARSPSSRRRASLLPHILVGVAAVALLATGAGLLASAGADYDALDRSCAPACNPADWAGVQTRANASYGLLAAGGIVAAADVALWIHHAVRS